MTQGRDGLSNALCPWVVVGNVVASVSETGGDSWVPAVRNIYRKGHRDFLILAGRHGTTLGGPTDANGWILPRGNDPAVDPADDMRSADALLSDRNNFPGLVIKVWDVEIYGCNHLPTLKQVIRSAIDRGFVVVLSWCYSLHSLKSYSPTAFPAASATAAGMTPIADTSADWACLGTYAKFEAMDAALGQSARLQPD